ncbi:BatA domain-containing protein [Ohtaekwangia sp.]|uniref:BatA domain-containing protein n=1 Tax=Ohtaekwangia sp. TaxID=2066019 RepID=UPI002FDCA828
MQFTNPIWLWALSGLAIPVAIHLLSRKEGKVMYVGSLRHLEESSTRQFRAIRLNEILLLILRCILITLIVLFLAGPTLSYTSSAPTRWLVIEPGMHSTEITPLCDSLMAAGYEKHFLSAGFPVTEDTSSTETKNYWSLLEQLGKKNISDIVVLSHTRQKDFTGERIPLPANIRWITTDEPQLSSVVFTQLYKSDSILIRKAESSATGTSYVYEKASVTHDATLQLHDTLLLTIAFDPDFQYDTHILEASLQSIQNIPVAVKINITSAKDFLYIPCDWLIWLSQQAIPVQDTCNTIVYQNTPVAPALLIPEGKQHPYKHYLLTEHITVENVLREHFTATLATILLADGRITDAALKADQRVLPESFLKKSETTGNEFLKAQPQSILIDSWFMALILAMLLIERLVSYKRNQ